jgi:hypothetical protein
MTTEQTIIRAKVELLELAKQLSNAYTQEIAQVTASIKAPTVKEQVEVVGELLDVSNIKRTFRMQVNDKIIQGKFEDAISTDRPVQLPRSYRAILNVLQRLIVDDGKEEIIYFLVRLESPEEARGALGR